MQKITLIEKKSLFTVTRSWDRYSGQNYHYFAQIVARTVEKDRNDILKIEKTPQKQ
jgi:hypothetical protein